MKLFFSYLNMPKSTVCCKKMIALKYGSSEHINNIFNTDNDNSYGSV